ncbi:hypothetical protein HPB50_009625 [Hyalomma asiaticum]|uniref:Uncharacterized protein n=1 Tax=Hyalomma asiaticum TaxID=266040 RepID=A0ACB7TEV2_HYAAI|nr:hypothetical protein HPB50_009625 [Hyalomma asiaticum]
MLLTLIEMRTNKTLSSLGGKRTQEKESAVIVTPTEAQSCCFDERDTCALQAGELGSVPYAGSCCVRTEDSGVCVHVALLARERRSPAAALLRAVRGVPACTAPGRSRAICTVGRCQEGVGIALSLATTLVATCGRVGELDKRWAGGRESMQPDGVVCERACSNDPDGGERRVRSFQGTAVRGCHTLTLPCGASAFAVSAPLGWRFELCHRQQALWNVPPFSRLRCRL